VNKDYQNQKAADFYSEWIFNTFFSKTKFCSTRDTLLFKIVSLL